MAPATDLELPMINERQEVALRAISRTFGQERGRDLVAGDVAHALGEAGFAGSWYSGLRKHPMGWTAATTCKALVRRELIAESPYRSSSAPWLVYYTITDLGLRVLAAIDDGSLEVKPSERRRY